MKSNPHFQRDGFSTITPYFVVEDLKTLIKFIEKTFEGKLHTKLLRKDGSIMHVEMQIGDAMLMLGEASPEFPSNNTMLYIYVEDCDVVFERALKYGATQQMPVTTMHHAGQRYGIVKDASGNAWCIATHLEDLSTAEEQRRIDSMS